MKHHTDQPQTRGSETSIYPIPIRRSYFLKILILVVGAMLLDVGLTSHYKSFWIAPSGLYTKELKTYEVCTLNKLIVMFPRDLACPAIAMEWFFVSVIILCFVLSVIEFGLGFMVNLNSMSWKYPDAGYHLVSAVLLAGAAVVYIISASQIHDIFTADGTTEEQMKRKGADLKTQEKYGAGLLAVIQSVLCAIAGIRGSRPPRDIQRTYQVDI